MKNLSISLTEEEYSLVKNYARKNKISIADAFKSAFSHEIKNDVVSKLTEREADEYFDNRVSNELEEVLADLNFQ